jgi:hypothetical protein
MNENTPLSERIKIVSALDYASGTADRDGATLDMAGYDGVLTIVKFATIAADGTNSIKMQQGASATLTDAADLAGTKIDVAHDDDNQIFVIDLFKPTERYVRVVVDKDTSHACAESAIYIQYAGRSLPVTLNVTDLVTGEAHVSPAEGTA